MGICVSQQSAGNSYGCFRRNLLSGPRLAISMTSMMGVVTQIPAAVETDMDA